MARKITFEAEFTDDGQVELRAEPTLPSLKARDLRVIAAGLEIAARGNEAEDNGNG